MHFTNLLAFAGASILGLSGVQAYSNFGATCQGSVLKGSTLQSTCRNRAGTYGTVYLDLNSCVVNTNGFLGCQSNGRYFQSCNNCGISGTTLRCLCNPGPHDTSLDLNRCVGNQDGQLVC
ncbi:putative effector protein [Ceratobasidium theobromae]|uniref:Putative effector protein n=1 Tax=Ceratobasidium theobromae TaxID=1582974 RepID=A0A5N5QDN6_9AGAM|nr:putative effector protein [Ceratobasidium theobromae]